MRSTLVWFLAAVLSACAREESGRVESSSPPESRLEHSAPPPEESRPFRQGFTQRPPPDTPGLPPAPEPFLDAAVPDRRTPREARERAQAALRSLVSEFEGAGAVDAAALVPRIRDAAREHVREGTLFYRFAEDFFKEYSFPSDVEKADAEYLGNVVVLTGAVAPHNMLDLSDGFKLFEQTPYVHEPMLLATSFELSFIRCHLARNELQLLRDWQEVHVLGVVEGKLGGDLVLKRCVVL